MPFIANQGNKLVYAGDAVDDGYYSCIGCESELAIRQEHARADYIVSGHFMHIGNDCGYESDRHLQMKLIAASAVTTVWPDADVYVDDRFVGQRKPDVLVEFNEVTYLTTIGAAMSIVSAIAVSVP